jgi:hypothetical protein
MHRISSLVVESRQGAATNFINSFGRKRKKIEKMKVSISMIHSQVGNLETALETEIKRGKKNLCMIVHQPVVTTIILQKHGR